MCASTIHSFDAQLQRYKIQSALFVQGQMPRDEKVLFSDRTERSFHRPYNGLYCYFTEYLMSIYAEKMAKKKGDSMKEILRSEPSNDHHADLVRGKSRLWK